MLNTPDELYKNADQFWKEYNEPWLENVVERGDDIILATEPDADHLYRFNNSTGQVELTGFGREYNYLIEHGYYYDSSSHRMFLNN